MRLHAGSDSASPSLYFFEFFKKDISISARSFPTCISFTLARSLSSSFISSGAFFPCGPSGHPLLQIRISWCNSCLLVRYPMFFWCFCIITVMRDAVFDDLDQFVKGDLSSFCHDGTASRFRRFQFIMTIILYDPFPELSP